MSVSPPLASAHQVSIEVAHAFIKSSSRRPPGNSSRDCFPYNPAANPPAFPSPSCNSLWGSRRYAPGSFELICCMNPLQITKASDRIRTPVSISVPQDRLGNNGATPSNFDSAAVPLERQNASFGSFDFLKLLETGPNGKSSNTF